MSLYTGKNRLIRSENRIKNIKGLSTSSEVDPEYFLAPKGTIHLRMKISGVIHNIDPGAVFPTLQFPCNLCIGPII
jgi:hypothetical protein